MAFVLFLIIFVLTSLQRYVLRDKDAAKDRKLERQATKARGGRAVTTEASMDVPVTRAGGTR